MPQIIPIRELKNTGTISEMCHSTGEPIFVTKNGYGDLVVMSMEAYEKAMLLIDTEARLNKAEEAINNGEIGDAKKSLADLRAKYAL